MHLYDSLKDLSQVMLNRIELSNGISAGCILYDNFNIGLGRVLL